MFVGGEHYYDERWKIATRVPFPYQTGNGYFLNGGQACIRVIGDYVVDHGIDTILLPAYLCPTIVETLTQSGIKVDFFRINEDFSIDLDDLSTRIAEFSNRAVYFIDYFGFSPGRPEIDFLRSLRERGTILVEDSAQAGFQEHTIGDFVFNSLRKFCPYDGAYLNAPCSMEKYIDPYRGRTNHRLPLIRRYRREYARYLFRDEGNADQLDELYTKAESYYLSDRIVEGDSDERAGIEILDWPAICQVRRENYTYLLNSIGDIPWIVPVLPFLQPTIMPMGLPVYFNGISREVVNVALGDASIGLTIHWENMHKSPLTQVQQLAMQMSERILTLNIDQYTTRAQLDYLAEKLFEAVRLAKSH
jgi:hypothetical protein